MHEQAPGLRGENDLDLQGLRHPQLARCLMLLKADADGPGWMDSKIAEAYNSRVQTIEKLRKRLVIEGFNLALNGKKRLEPPTPSFYDGWKIQQVIEATFAAHAQDCAVAIPNDSGDG